MEDQILRVVKEQHKIVLVFAGQNDGAHVFDLVEARLFVGAVAADLERVDVVRRLDIDAVFALRATHLVDLAGQLAEHDVLVLALELGLDSRRYQSVHHCC